MPFELRESQDPEPRRGRRGAGKATAKETEDPVSEVFPMELVVEMPPRGFQEMLNGLSNTAAALGGEDAAAAGELAGEYYFVTRWLRVENETPTGPERTAVEDEADEEEEAVDQEQKDLNMVFGAEKVRAYLALDLVRFLTPKAAANN